MLAVPLAEGGGGRGAGFRRPPDSPRPVPCRMSPVGAPPKAPVRDRNTSASEAPAPRAARLLSCRCLCGGGGAPPQLCGCLRGGGGLACRARWALRQSPGLPNSASGSGRRWWLGAACTPLSSGTPAVAEIEDVIEVCEAGMGLRPDTPGMTNGRLGRTGPLYLTAEGQPLGPSSAGPCKQCLGGRNPISQKKKFPDDFWYTNPGPPPPPTRGAFEGKGPQRWPQRRLGRRLEEVAKAVGGGYCRLQMPLRLALGVRGTVAGHRLGALEGGGEVCIPAPPPPPLRAAPTPPFA